MHELLYEEIDNWYTRVQVLTYMKTVITKTRNRK